MTSVLSLPFAALESAFAMRSDLAELWKRIWDGATEFSPAETVQLLIVESIVYSRRDGNFSYALVIAQRALELAIQIQDRKGISGARARIGAYFWGLGDFVAAEHASLESLAIADETIEATVALLMMGMITHFTHRWQESERYYDESLRLSRAFNDTPGIGVALHNLALLYRDQGQFDLCLNTSREASAIIRGFGGPAWGYALNKASVCLIQGDRAAVRAAIADYYDQESIDPVVLAMLHGIQGALAIDEEAFDDAEIHCQHVLSFAEQTGAPSFQHDARIAFSRLRRLQGDVADAARWANAALTYAQRIGNHAQACNACIELGRARWAQDDADLAEVELLIALDIAAPLGAEYLAAQASFLLAALRSQLQRPESEAMWVDAARRIKQGGYGFIYERERGLAYPLVAAYAKSKNAEARQASEQALAQLAKIPPRPLRIIGLGRFEVHQGQRRIPSTEWKRRRAGELFRFLLLQPRHQAYRDTTMATLWPDVDAEAAQQSLHHASSTLRRVLEPDLPDKFPSRYLLFEDDRLTLRLPSGSRVDFEAFAHAATTTPEAATDYGGELFPDDRAADWAVARREQLHALHLGVWLAQATAQLNRHEPAAALELAQRILAEDAWREDAVALGMRAALELGDRPAALRLYVALEQALKGDLGIDPRADLRVLVAELRR